MSYKRVKKLHKKVEDKPIQRWFALGWVIQAKLNLQNYDLMSIDEFSLSDHFFIFFGWNKRGNSKCINAMPYTFWMSFYIAFSKNRFYGIMKVEGTGNSEKLIHFLAKVLEERSRLDKDETKRLVIVLNNASIHKTGKIITHLLFAQKTLWSLFRPMSPVWIR